jgi:TetR/AcrR family transcriptional repressor of nem operon
MRVSKEKAAENHQRIVDVASAMFREKGFDGVGVADLMKGAGLTHGGFYGHFASKDDLAARACARALQGSEENWTKLVGQEPDRPLGAVVSSYLSSSHRDNPGRGCAMTALGCDIARQEGPVRKAFTQGVRPLLAILERIVPGRAAAARRERALATMAGLVGAVILARAVDDPALSDEFLQAAERVLAGRAS